MMVRSPTWRREKSEQTEERERETSGAQPRDCAAEMGAERRDDEEEDAVGAAMIPADKRRRSRTEIGRSSRG